MQAMVHAKDVNSFEDDGGVEFEDDGRGVPPVVTRWWWCCCEPAMNKARNETVT